MTKSDLRFGSLNLDFVSPAQLILLKALEKNRICWTFPKTVKKLGETCAKRKTFLRFSMPSHYFHMGLILVFYKS